MGDPGDDIESSEVDMESEYDDEEHDEPDYEEDEWERERREAVASVFAALHKLTATWSSPPKVLAHYTSVPNAVRIIDNGEIWLFNAYTMNDEQEIDHAIEFITKQLGEEFPELGKVLADRWGFPQTGQRSVYVFCLSPTDDLDRLSMWRAYGDDGNGVALEIRTGALAGSANDLLPEMTPLVAEVVYDDADKARRIRELVCEFEASSQTYEDMSEEDLADALSSILWKVAPTFKHHAFREEREWRVIVEVDKPIFSKMPDRSSLVEFLDDRRPFVRLKLAKVAGEGILSILDPAMFDGALVGPSRNSRANAATIDAALLKKHWNRRTKVSSIPYRGRS